MYYIKRTKYHHIFNMKYDITDCSTYSKLKKNNINNELYELSLKQYIVRKIMEQGIAKKKVKVIEYTDDDWFGKNKKTNLKTQERKEYEKIEYVFNLDYNVLEQNTIEKLQTDYNVDINLHSFIDSIENKDLFFGTITIYKTALRELPVYINMLIPSVRWIKHVKYNEKEVMGISFKNGDKYDITTEEMYMLWYQCKRIFSGLVNHKLIVSNKKNQKLFDTILNISCIVNNKIKKNPYNVNKYNNLLVEICEKNKLKFNNYKSFKRELYKKNSDFIKLVEKYNKVGKDFIVAIKKYYANHLTKTKEKYMKKIINTIINHKIIILRTCNLHGKKYINKMKNIRIAKEKERERIEYEKANPATYKEKLEKPKTKWSRRKAPEVKEKPKDDKFMSWRRNTSERTTNNNWTRKPKNEVPRGKWNRKTINNDVEKSRRNFNNWRSGKPVIIEEKQK